MDTHTDIVTLVTLLLAGVAATEEPAPHPPSGSATWIEWDPSTRVLVQKGAGYARLVRLGNRELLVAFEQAGRLRVRHSRDEGKTWEAAIEVAAIDGSVCTNAELLVLADGAVLALFNERPREALPGSKTPREGLTRPFRIHVSRSRDHGKTWGAPELLYSAGSEFDNGCWEPAAIQLPDGEVQVFFANEGPYRKTQEQEITMIRSKDAGGTWSPPQAVSFRPGHRDGMPVPLVLQDQRGIVLAIEDNGLSGHFKPAIIHTSMEDNWNSGVAGAGSPRRRGALKDPLPATVYAGAPYLRQSPDGRVLLSYQESDKGDLQKTRMVVCVGDRDARNFGQPTHPFSADALPQLWNSLFVKDAQTVTAVSDAVIGGVHGIWAVDGKIRQEAPAER